jgi:hypothetical protein
MFLRYLILYHTLCDFILSFLILDMVFIIIVISQMTSESKAIVPTSSHGAVSVSMQEGFQAMVVQAGVGLVVGGMAGIVLTRGGSGSARKIFAGFGAGAGAGSAWTKCSMTIDDLLK